jgi:release factor glutamine methyltransferase
MTAAALVAEAARILAAAGVEAPEWDAERLLRHVLGWDRARLLASPTHPVTASDEERFRLLLARRASREPLQYILGTQAFWKHDFLVTPAVLIPRPETELLVETSLDLLKDVERPLVVDVGTGSGCIALSLAVERPDAEVHATDISEPALTVARENARRLGLEGRVTFHHGDLLEPVARLAGRVDLVVSNPPNVDPADRGALAPEVRDHEPSTALFPDEGPLGVYGRLAAAASRHLRPRGWLVLEMGASLAEGVAKACAGAGLEVQPPLIDLAHLPRVIAAQTR